MGSGVAYRLDIVAGYKADEVFAGVGSLEFGLPPLGVVVFENVEDVVFLNGQFLLGVCLVVVEGHADLEERHGSVASVLCCE